MKIKKKFLAWALLGAAALSSAAGAVEQPSSGRLSEIKQELAQKKAALERYQKECVKLEERLGRQARKLEESRSERTRLEALHKSAVAEKRRLQADLRSLEGSLKGLASKAGGMANLYYLRSLMAEPFFGRYELLGNAVLGQTLSQDLGRWQFIQAQRDQVSGQAQEADRKAGDLRAKAAIETQKERQVRLKLDAKQRQLKEAQDRLAQTRRELDDLEASAKEMDRLVVRLARKAAERKAAAERRAAHRKAVVQARSEKPEASAPWAAHSLPWPAEGRVVSSFGKQRVESLGAWMLNRGIRLATPMGQRVSAVGAGQVIYAGNFRGYGRVVIVDHEGGWVSVYGHLGSLDKAAGDQVRAGEALGTAGQPQDGAPQLVSIPEGRSSLYFEIRRGNKAVDPLKWLEKK